MRFDKETLVKHRFWVVLAAVLPLMLIAIVVLMTVVASEIYGERAKLQEALKNVQSKLADIKNQKHIEIVEKLAADLEAQQETVWKQVYNEQKILTEGDTAWPGTFNNTFHFNDGLFARRIHHARGEQVAVPPPEGKPWFQGEITTKPLRDYLEVSGTGSEFKEKVTKRFYRTERLKITDKNGELPFYKMKEHDNVQIIYQVGKYFNDPLTDSERVKFAKDYYDQIAAILEQVEPVNEEGKGIVQFKDWVFRKGQKPPSGGFITYVDRPWDLSRDFSEEAWVAQEDLWIQREIYRLVRLANDYVAKFNHESGDGIKSPYVCSNPYWKLEMLLKGGKMQVKISNLTSLRQPLELPLWINFSNPKAAAEMDKLPLTSRAAFRRQNFEFVDKIEGEPLNPSGYPNAFREMTVDLEIETVPRKQIYGVEQVLSWKTAAVKRIDEIAIGEHSHRTIPKGLKRLKEEAAPIDPLGQPMPPQFPPPDGGPRQPGGVRGDLSPHGLLMARYSEVTPQGRRVPVGIVVIVDQQHVNRTLLAFSNSNLRLVITQVIQNHFPSSVTLRPQVFAPMPKGPGFGFPPPGRGGEGGFQPPFQPFQPFGGGQQQVSDEQEANVELVIYGILTLYERHPPKVLEPDEQVQPNVPMPDPNAPAV